MLFLKVFLENVNLKKKIADNNLKKNYPECIVKEKLKVFAIITIT